MTVETRRVCVLSMAHLTEKTALLLINTPNDEWPVHGGKMGDDMLTVYVGEEDHNLPADLSACLAWARQQGAADPTAISPVFGFDYVMFDRDVDPEEDGSGLPDYSSDTVMAAVLDRAAFLKLWTDAEALDVEINCSMRRPTAEDYNRLRALIQRSKRPA